MQLFVNSNPYPTQRKKRTNKNKNFLSKNVKNFKLTAIKDFMHIFFQLFSGNPDCNRIQQKNNIRFTVHYYCSSLSLTTRVLVGGGGLTLRVFADETVRIITSIQI